MAVSAIQDTPSSPMAHYLCTLASCRRMPLNDGQTPLMNNQRQTAYLAEGLLRGNDDARFPSPRTVSSFAINDTGEIFDGLSEFRYDNAGPQVQMDALRYLAAYNTSISGLPSTALYATPSGNSAINNKGQIAFTMNYRDQGTNGQMADHHAIVLDTPIVNIFIGGFFDDTAGQIVHNYEKRFEAIHPEASVQYFHWDELSQIEGFLRNLPQDEAVNLIGHSFGGDTAARIAAEGIRQLKVLITIDPVTSPHTEAPQVEGKKMVLPPPTLIPQAYFEGIKTNVSLWVDVNSTGGSPLEFSNVIAATADWGETPKGHADRFFNQDISTHADFRSMMDCQGPQGEKPPVNSLTGN